MTATNRRPALCTKLAGAWPAENWRDVTVLVAVSGGADSVALARALVDLRRPGEGRLVLAHFNHKMRGAESDGDQAFVEELGRGLGLEVVVGARSTSYSYSSSSSFSFSSSSSFSSSTSTEMTPRPPTSEESLRSLRYQFLAESAGQVGARYVATAHTADDQVETVLANFLRGTGLAGLAGIPRTRQLTDATTLIRPLLDVTRAEVLEYLRQIGQPVREDSSNARADYTRNRIRHELLPLLAREYNPEVRAAILRLSRLAGEADDEITGLAADLAAQYVQPIAGGFEISVQRLSTLSDFLARSLLRAAWRSQGWPEQEMGLAEWDSLLALAREERAAPRNFPGAVRAQSSSGTMRLTRP
jgi:tRNA(Ile)-lysidine synthase